MRDKSWWTKLMRKCTKLIISKDRGSNCCSKDKLWRSRFRNKKEIWWKNWKRWSKEKLIQTNFWKVWPKKALRLLEWSILIGMKIQEWWLPNLNNTRKHKEVEKVRNKSRKIWIVWYKSKMLRCWNSLKTSNSCKTRDNLNFQELQESKNESYRNSSGCREQELKCVSKNFQSNYFMT